MGAIIEVQEVVLRSRMTVSLSIIPSFHLFLFIHSFISPSLFFFICPFPSTLFLFSVNLGIIFLTSSHIVCPFYSFSSAVNFHAASSKGLKSPGNTRPAATAVGMDEKEKERERERDTVKDNTQRPGCSISSRSSSMKKKKTNTVMDSINHIGSFFTGSSRSINEVSSKRKKSQIEISQKTKEREKRIEDFDKDRIIDSYRREIGSNRDKDKDRDKDKERDRERDAELGLGYGLGSGLGCIPASDVTAPQDQTIQESAIRERGVRERERVREEEDQEEDEHRRVESVGTFHTVNDGVSSVEMAMWSHTDSGLKNNPRPDMKSHGVK
jgi:hypothetical protein